MIRVPTGAATPAAIVDAMKAMAGASPKARASFASGRCVRGTYIPSDRADEITKSRSFTSSITRAGALLGGRRHPRVPEPPISCCAASASGWATPTIAPTSSLRALRFIMRGRSTRCWRISRRACPGPDGRPDPEKLKAFSTANPESSHQASYVAAHPLPASFADTTYWAVHAFPATNRSDETQFIKFKVVPVSNQAAPTEDANTKPGDFLHDDLESRIAARDIRFSLMAVLGHPGDPILDVTIRWPDEDRRETVRLGTIVITAIEANDCDAYVFDPAALAEGIGYPPDEIFAARRAAYTISRAQAPLIEGSAFARPGALRFAAPRCGAGADLRRKHPRKVALIGEPGRDRNFGQRQVSRGHQLLGRVHPLTQQPLVRRQAGRDSKRARKMADRETKLNRELLQRNRSAEVRVESFAGSLHLPWGETAASQRADGSQPAIVLRGMRGECEHRVIDEELVDLGRPTQRLQQCPADMPDDRVIMTGTELSGEFTHTRCVGLLGDRVERRARKIEMERVEWPVDDEAHIVLHVVQICCTRTDIGLDRTPAALPGLTIRVIVKHQGDNIGILKAHLAGDTFNGCIIPGLSNGYLGVTKRTRDQRNRFLLQMKKPLHGLTVET